MRSAARSISDQGSLASLGWELARTAGSTAWLYFLPGRDSALAWRELLDKVEVFLLVQRIGERIGVPPAGQPFDLPLLLRRAYDLGEYAALWAVEGLGHDWLLHEWTGARAPRDLLSGPLGRELPPESLTMLHAGIGLGLADRLIHGLPPAPPVAEVRLAVERDLDLCRANSRPGYEGAALESLGLVTRTYRARLVPTVDRILREIDPVAREYFWHGAGRALYFLPINFVPCGRTTWRPFEMAVHEAPDASASRNARAGVAWAYTLVNMRQPAIVDRLLLDDHGAELALDEAFSNGVASAVMVRRDTTPDGELLDRFLDYRPSAGTERWWRCLVAEPSVHALERIYPGLVKSGDLGEIFRYQPFVTAGTGDCLRGEAG